ncbi:DUF4097 family beta strand repeat-containing protein [Halobacteriovorax sp. GFR7]|uniref:DUF4097 family beta strand repeat-containing protein n=1 Tax=unclassified Halobacteriovorax TaxID=2639665 RepID=UPI003D965A1F
MKYFIACASLLFTSMLFAEEKSFEISKGLLDFESTSGNVSITGTESSLMKISYTKKEWDEGCNLKMEQSNNVVSVKVQKNKKKSSGWFSSGPRCELDFNITMPKQVKLLSKLGSGNTSITGLNADSDLTSGSGQITITNSAMDSLKAFLGSGDINAKGQFKKVNFESGSGNIKLINPQIKTLKAQLNSGSGDITVIVPRGIKVNSKLESASGKLINKAGNSDDSEISIKASTGSGDVTIENI